MSSDSVTKLEKSWTIGEVAKRAGLETSAIRYYESIGLLPEPARVNGRRRYDEQVSRWLALIDTAQQAGFTLDEIRTLKDGFASDASPSKRWQELAREKLEGIEALISRAEGMKRLLEEGLRCDCLKLEESDFVSAGIEWAEQKSRETKPA